MNAMIRVLKGTLAMLALAGIGLLLRWMTAGSISGVRTYDLDSLTVLAVGTIAWIAYGWLVLAVVLTVLEQIPGVVGSLAGAVAGRITTKTARALLRSGLGVAAVTPMTVGVAHATPGDTAHVRQWNQPSSTAQLTDSDYRSTEPRSTVQLGTTDTSYRSTEPASTVEIGNSDTTSQQATEDRTNYRATEPASAVEIGGPETDLRRTSTDNTAPQQRTNDWRSTEPRSTVEIGNSDTKSPQTPQNHTNYRSTEPPSKLRLTNSTPTTPDRPATPNAPANTDGTPGRGHAASARPATPNAPTNTDGTPAGGRKADGGTDLPSGGRVGVPDRPTAGAPTRYTDLRPAVPVRIVVREGDSLWSIAARELGPDATAEAIAARWPDWYAANRHVIGDDPDLILPGQVLRIPPAGHHLPPHHQEQ